MTLPSTGSISFSQLASEYAQTNTNVSLGSYYYGGTILRSNTCTDAVKTYQDNTAGFTAHFKDIPTSQSNMSLSLYRGKTYYYARQTTITVSGSDAGVVTTNIENETPSNKRNSEHSAYFVVQTSGDCQASAVSTRGLTVGIANRPYTSCYLINSNRIRGRGGRGGKGEDNRSNGQDGGPALRIRPNAYINNTGRILGGGGGGGGGNSQRQSYRQCWFCGTTNISAGGGGGGGGKGGGDGGAGGDRPSANFGQSGRPGQAGNYNDTGSGGSGGSGGQASERGGRASGQAGGTGGGWGNSGQGRASGGGSAGRSVQFQSGKTGVFVSTGTVEGSTQAI